VAKKRVQFRQKMKGCMCLMH